LSFFQLIYFSCKCVFGGGDTALLHRCNPWEEKWWNFFVLANVFFEGILPSCTGSFPGKKNGVKMKGVFAFKVKV
jgi:hypothetical protein